MEQLNVLSLSPMSPNSAGDAPNSPRRAGFHAVLMTALGEGAALVPGSTLRDSALPNFNRGRRVAAATSAGFSRL